MNFEQQLIKDILSNKVLKNVYGYVNVNTKELQKDKDLYRQYFLNDPDMAYFYARFVDECPREDTRAVACGDPEEAYWYALFVDECPRDDTREAACGKHSYAYYYAKDVDEKAILGTFKAVQYTKWEIWYIADVGKPSEL